MSTNSQTSTKSPLQIQFDLDSDVEAALLRRGYDHDDAIELLHATLLWMHTVVPEAQSLDITTDVLAGLFHKQFREDVLDILPTPDIARGEGAGSITSQRAVWLRGSVQTALDYLGCWLSVWRKWLS